MGQIQVSTIKEANDIGPDPLFYCIAYNFELQDSTSTLQHVYQKHLQSHLTDIFVNVLDIST